jgi:hypothetical protein
MPGPPRDIPSNHTPPMYVRCLYLRYLKIYSQIEWLQMEVRCCFHLFLWQSMRLCMILEVFQYQHQRPPAIMMMFTFQITTREVLQNVYFIQTSQKVISKIKTVKMKIHDKNNKAK